MLIHCILYELSTLFQPTIFFFFFASIVKSTNINYALITLFISTGNKMQWVMIKPCLADHVYMYICIITDEKMTSVIFSRADPVPVMDSDFTRHFR